jgi:Protein of unknown function (DUF4232)
MASIRPPMLLPTRGLAESRTDAARGMIEAARGMIVSRRHVLIRRPIALLAAVVLVAGACGGNVPTLRPSGSAAGASPSGATLGASTDPTDANLTPCKSTDLVAGISGWSGQPGSRFASVVVTSKSGVTCTVRGTPGVRLLDGKGKVVLDSAKIKSVGGPKVATGDPVVVLGPGDELALDVVWTNWCKTQPARPLTLVLVLTDKGGILKVTKAKKSGHDDAPTCASKSKASEVRVTHAWLGPGI